MQVASSTTQWTFIKQYHYTVMGVPSSVMPGHYNGFNHPLLGLGGIKLLILCSLQPWPSKPRVASLVDSNAATHSCLSYEKGSRLWTMSDFMPKSTYYNDW